MITNLFFLITGIVTGLYLIMMTWHWYQTPKVILSWQEKIKLIFSGVLAFAAETVTIGSFTGNITMAKGLSTFSDKELPALVNGIQVVPGYVLALFFIHHIDVDSLTLITLVSATCLGVLAGSFWIPSLSEQGIRKLMIISFMTIIFALICHHLHWMPDEGETRLLRNGHLILGFIGLFICGALTLGGVGLFISVQACLFLLNMSAMIVFPIMAIASTIQQPLSGFIFLQKRQIPLQKAMWIMIPGIMTMLALMPLVDYLVVSWLHNVLLFLLAFNIVMLSQSAWRSRQTAMGALIPG